MLKRLVDTEADEKMWTLLRWLTGGRGRAWYSKSWRISKIEGSASKSELNVKEYEQTGFDEREKACFKCDSAQWTYKLEEKVAKIVWVIDQTAGRRWKKHR